MNNADKFFFLDKATDMLADMLMNEPPQNGEPFNIWVKVVARRLVKRILNNCQCNSCIETCYYIELLNIEIQNEEC